MNKFLLQQGYSLCLIDFHNVLAHRNEKRVRKENADTGKVRVVTRSDEFLVVKEAEPVDESKSGGNHDIP